MLKCDSTAPLALASSTKDLTKHVFTDQSANSFIWASQSVIFSALIILNKIGFIGDSIFEDIHPLLHSLQILFTVKSSDFFPLPIRLIGFFNMLFEVKV